MARGLAWGDVRLVEFGAPDKTRPALVLTRNSAFPCLSAITVAPISRSMRGIVTELPVGTEQGLKTDSAANFDAVQTVAKRKVGRYLGSLRSDKKPLVRSAILFALDLDEHSRS